MKIGFLDNLLDLVYTGTTLEIECPSLDTCYFITWNETTNKIVVSYHIWEDENKPYEEAEYTSFRNGDYTAPDMEQFCPKWSETINAPDAVVFFN